MCYWLDSSVSRVTQRSEAAAARYVGRSASLEVDGGQWMTRSIESEWVSRTLGLWSSAKNVCIVEGKKIDMQRN